MVAVQLATDQDDRRLRRDRTCVATGAGFGAAFGVLVPAGGLALGLIGALAGAAVGKRVASHLSPDDWDPQANHRPNVGANSPDDDITS